MVAFFQVPILDFLVAKHLFAPSLIKIDVGGAEHNVLRGAVVTLHSPSTKSVINSS
jgi:FkbM family methyltransferase